MLTTRAESASLKSSIHALASGTRRAVSRAERIGAQAAENLDSPIDAIQHNLAMSRETGTKLVNGLEEARRKALANAEQLAGAVVEHSRAAVGDTVDLLQRSTAVKTLTELLVLHSAYVRRRGFAAFKIVEDLNAIGRSQAMALWSPMGRVIEDSAQPAGPAVSPKPKKQARVLAWEAAAVKRSGRKPVQASAGRRKGSQVARKAARQSAR